MVRGAVGVGDNAVAERRCLQGCSGGGGMMSGTKVMSSGGGERSFAALASYRPPA